MKKFLIRLIKSESRRLKMICSSCKYLDSYESCANFKAPCVKHIDEDTAKKWGCLYWEKNRG